jgi:hypothetical protein
MEQGMQSWKHVVELFVGGFMETLCRVVKGLMLVLQKKISNILRDIND